MNGKSVPTRLPPFATSALLAVARRYMTQEPSQILGRNPDDPYLKRWFLEKNSDGSVYIHQTLRSDAEVELHDHPAESMSIVLDGAIREITPDGVRHLVAGDVVVRTAEDRHRLEIDAPTTTIFIMGARTNRVWGFWDGDEFTPSQELFKRRGYF